jgi:hypothetical protein
MIEFPRQDIPESEKTSEWCSKHLDYAEMLYLERAAERKKMTRLNQVYVGLVESASIKWLTKKYEKENSTKFVSYRISSPKLALVAGEWLNRPLHTTVYSTNIDAKAEKLEKFEFLLGAMHMKKEIEKLKESGVDVMEGMDIPDKDAENPWEGISLKGKNEDIMQVIINEIVNTEEIRDAFNENWRDMMVVSEVHGKVYIKRNNEIEYRPIDPRDAIFVPIARDKYCERSPIRGEVRRMTMNELLEEFNLTDEQRKKLNDMRGEQGKFSEEVSKPAMYISGKELLTEVISIEWKTSEPIYWKKVPIKDQPDKFRTTMITAENYEKRKANIRKDVSKGLYEIETTYHDIWWEAHRIGKELDVKAQKKEFVMKSVDDPSETIGSYYCSCIFNEVDGIKISLQELCENLSMQYDIVMYQINKELAKAKGMTLIVDQAGIPAKKKIRDVLYEAINDGIVMGNSSAQSNTGQKNIDDLTKMFKQVDLGVSASFPYLIQLKQDIERTLDKITGINENREGMTKATMTATNAQASVEASRSITEPMFYAMDMFVEKVLMKMAELSKMVWGYNKCDKGEYVLGTDRMGFLRVTKEILGANYGTYLTDSRRELKLREKMGGLAEFALNSKEIRYLDIMESEAKETYQEALAVIKNGWATVEKIKGEQAQADREQEIKLAEQRRQEYIEDREDRQKHAIQIAQINKGLDIQRDALNAKNDLALQQNSDEELAGME